MSELLQNVSRAKHFSALPYRARYNERRPNPSFSPRRQSAGVPSQGATLWPSANV